MIHQNRNIIKSRIENLRQKMKEYDIDAYLVLSDDFHASEYVSDYFKCRAYISGFTGSAGTVVITKDEVCLWTDGRYFIQAEKQLNGTGILLQKKGEDGVPKVREYLRTVLKEGQVLGYDGRTVSVKYANELRDTLRDVKICDTVDLIGEIWKDRPAFPHSPIWELDEKYAGKSRALKLADVREEMIKKGVDALLISSLDDIAWLYNLRGNDIAFSPLFLAYTMIFRDKSVLYVNESAISEELAGKLENEGIVIRSYFKIYDDFKKLKNISVFIDEDCMNVALKNAIHTENHIVNGACPTILQKSIKNETEINNERYAHLLDGIAVTKVIYRIKKAVETGSIAEFTELGICELLENLRMQGNGYIGQSFAPIVASGEHGAIVHYEPTKESDIYVERNSFLLMDTGGHYLYGTTDITRTIAIGELSHEQKKLYTAVLKGHLNLGAARFVSGTPGSDLDESARKPLKGLGYDYKHGTGHGVGYLLNVHEGPQSIRVKEKDENRKKCRKNPEVPLKPGMITSDEPGVYLEGKYGIRIENLMLCKEVTGHDAMNEQNTYIFSGKDRQSNNIFPDKDRQGTYIFSDKDRQCNSIPYEESEQGGYTMPERLQNAENGLLLGFEHLTLVPYEKDAILPDMMTDNELKLLNNYHKMVCEKISPYLNDDEKNWLKAQTAEIRKA